MNMTMSTTSPQDIRYLAELIKGIRVAMLTTVCKDGSLRSRPMATLQPDFDGTLWFFANTESRKKDEEDDEGQVNVTYENSADHVYVSLSGRATLVPDRQRIEELWNEEAKPWFPGGVNDPGLTLLRVDVDKWEYWDAQSNAMEKRSGLLTEKNAADLHQHGEHQRVDLGAAWVSQDVGTKKDRNDVP